ncbi:hypothetical protein [Mesorhizobium sp. A623]
MSDDPDTPRNRGLNPTLKSRNNTSRDTETPTRAPADSASVQREEGRAWPMIWLVVGVICAVIVIFLVLG